jgi:hypothetical protein
MAVLRGRDADWCKCEIRFGAASGRARECHATLALHLHGTGERPVGGQELPLYCVKEHQLASLKPGQEDEEPTEQ